jgi:glycosyltransferase involved in cell wall biosynthesis
MENILLKSCLETNNNLNVEVALTSKKLIDTLFGPIIFIYKFYRLAAKMDFIYIYTPFTYLLLISPILLLKRNVGLYVRGDLTKVKSIKLHIYRRLIQKSKFVLCTGPFLTSYCKTLNPKAHEVVPMLNISSPNNSQMRSLKQINLLYLSGISKNKGTYDFLSIINKILSDFPNVYVTIAGGGPKKQMDEFKVLFNQIINKDKITFLGRIEEKAEIIEIFRKNNVFIHTSYSEGFPRVIIEAMSQGLIIISSSIPAITNFLSNKINCLLFKPGNLEEIYECIKEVVYNNELMIDIQNSANELINNKFLYYKKEVSHASQINKYFLETSVMTN